MVEFYSVAKRMFVTVPHDKVRHEMAGKRHRLTADYDGMRLSKFVSAAEAAKYK